MENSRPEPEYGWSEEPSSSKRGGGKRLLLGMAGVALIAFGVFSAVSVNTSEISRPVAVEISRPVEITRAETRQVYLMEDSIEPLLNRQIDISDVEEIYIDAAAAEVTVTGHDADELDVSIKTHSDVQYNISSVGDRVVISNDRNLSPTAGRAADTVTVRIPYDYDGDLKLLCSAGMANLSDISGESLSLELSAGGASIDGVDFEETELKISAGFVKGTMSAEIFKLSASQAEINLEGGLGDTYCDSAMSSVTLSYDDIPEEIDINSSIGDVNIYLPAHAEFRLENAAIMGELICEFTDMPDADSEISANISMGSVKILKK